jgi:hypothetical protein
MKPCTTRFIVVPFLASLIMFLSNNSYGQQYDKRVTVLYTHDLQGIVEPCG